VIRVEILDRDRTGDGGPLIRNEWARLGDPQSGRVLLAYRGCGRQQHDRNRQDGGDDLLRRRDGANPK
jgi:hypothetical protein